MNGQEFKKNILPINQKLFRLCLKYLGNQFEAEDALQEVYLKLWNIRDKLKDIKNLEAFSVTITKNLCLDKLKMKPLISIDSGKLQISNEEVFEENPLQFTENHNNFEIIHEIIGKLPDQMQLIIRLRDIEEFDFDEIMEITGLNLNNIRVILSRARKIVKNELLRIHEFGTKTY